MKQKGESKKSGLFLGLILCLPGLAQEDNQTQEFAIARAQRVSEVSYALSFDLKKGSETYAGTVSIECRLNAANEPLIVDFSGEAVNRVSVDGAEVNDFQFSDKKGRIAIPAHHLKSGKQSLDIDFTGRFSQVGAGFHRFLDPKDQLEYLYTDFQPNDAHRMFPCFDQPDIRASYALEVLAPADWEVIANNPVEAKLREGDRQRLRFLKTKPFSTYLFHLSAGPYASWHDPEFRIPLGVYCRQSLAESMDAARMFDITRKGFDFFETYFDFPYPFEKYDQIFVPEFNAGAMENVGAVTFSEGFIYQSKPTQSSLELRDMVVMHEMAHMWFGDLVTMKWWDDLWLNESFASYMAYVALDAVGSPNVWTRASRGKSGVFIADQRVTTHPIVARIPDIRAASNIFDNITYGKGQAVLRQLDYFLGGHVFRDGLRIYFKENAWRNTTLDDFIAALEQAAGKSLSRWVESWLKTSDVNTLRIAFETKDGNIADATALQAHGKNNEVLRPHAADVGLYRLDPSGKPVMTEKVKIHYDGPSTPLPSLNGKPVPVFMLPNVSDNDYVKVSLDPQSLAWLTENIGTIPDLETKHLVWGILWDMLKDADLGPATFLDLALRQLPDESEIQILNQLMSRTEQVVDRYVPDEASCLAFRERINEMALTHLRRQAPGSDHQQAWFDLWVSSSVSETHMDRLVQTFEGNLAFDGLDIDHRRKWGLLASLAKAGDARVDGLAQRLAEEDRSAYGMNYRLYLSSLKPTAEAHESAWKDLTTENDYSLSQLRWILYGFNDGNRETLVGPFIDKYFEYLPTAYKERDWGFVSRFAGLAFPYRGYEKTLKRAERFLKRSDLDQTLRNLVLEELDDLKRDMKIREQWRSPGNI